MSQLAGYPVGSGHHRHRHRPRRWRGYEQDGREYVVLMTGGHHFMKTPIGDQVIAWALPTKG
jgi:hypothetical protein